MRRCFFLGTILLALATAGAKAEVGPGREGIELAGFWLGGAALLLLSLTLAQALRKRRQLAEKNREIEDANRRLRAFIEAQGDLAYLKDEKFRYVYANSAAGRFHDTEPEKLIGKDDYAISEADFADARRRADLDALAAGAPTQSSLAHRDRLYHVTKFPVPLSGGKTGVGTYARDVTEEARAQRRARMESRRLQILSSIVTRAFRDVREQLAFVLEDAVSLTGSKYGYAFLYDEETQTLTEITLSEGIRKDSALTLPTDALCLENAGIWGEVVRTRRPVILNDCAAPRPLKRGLPPGHAEIRRFLSVPVLIDGKIVAAVGLANRDEEYEDADAYELTLFMTGVWNDIRRREALSRLNFERARHLQTLVSIGDGVMVADTEGKIEMLNRAAEEMTGWKTSEAVGKRYLDVFDVRFTGIVHIDPIAEALRTGAVATMGEGTVLIARDGTERVLEDSAAPIRDETGAVAGVVLVFRDVTQKKEQLEKITYLSFHDALTGLHNRRYLTDAFARLEADEGNLPLAVVMGDLNGLKLTNDIFGHAAGDLLLEKVADVLRDTARPQDVIGRWGGDEFLALLPRTDRAGAAAFTARVKDAFAREHVKAIKGSISMGCACKESPEENAQVVFSMAEDSMYNAKTFERDEAYRSTVGELIRSLHRMYAREATHSDAVRALSVRIARALALPPEEIRKIGDAGYLHDIGKIVLDAGTLDESRPLTDVEWNEIRRHPIVGYRILNAFDDTMDIAEPVLAHHEHWNGQGYPRGLKGDQIPLIARIVSVAEACDRMTRRAEGAKATDPDEIVRELRANAGAQFDPLVVEALARVLEEA